MCIYVTILEYVTKMEMMSKNREAASGIASAVFHFHRVEEQDGVRYLVFIYPSDGRMMSLNVGFNVYEDSLGIIGRNPDIVPSDNFMKIDQDWILSFMK